MTPNGDDRAGENEARVHLEIWLLAALLLVGAAALRLAGARSGGLWLDEIWSVQLAQDLSSPFAVLRIGLDNNHPLNTLVLSFLASGATHLSKPPGSSESWASC